MSDKFDIKDQHLIFPHSILTRYVVNLAKVIDKFRTIDRSFRSEVLDSGIRYNRFNMVVNRYKFDIFTSTYKVDIHYGPVYIKYVYDYENEYIVNMHIAPPSWDYINIEKPLCAIRSFTIFLRSILESDTAEDFKIVDDNCITIIANDEILYLSSGKNNNEDVKLYKKLHNMIHSLLNDELSIRKNVRGVDYEDGVYTIRVINNYVMRYYKYINLLHIRTSDSSDLYTILDFIEEV